MSVLLLALLFLGEVGAFVDSAGDARLLSIGVASAALKAGTSLLYQRAMQLSPVSLSVPYLAFTPMLLLVTSYFLLGERPSWRGVLGVVVMTAGAYGLNGARGGDAEKTAAPSGSGSAGKGGKIKAGALPANEKVLEKAKEKASRDHLRGATARAAEDGAGTLRIFHISISCSSCSLVSILTSGCASRAPEHGAVRDGARCRHARAIRAARPVPSGGGARQNARSGRATVGCDRSLTGRDLRDPRTVAKKLMTADTVAR